MNLDISKMYNDVVSYIAVTIIGGMLTWVLMLRRKVNTNEAQILQDRMSHIAQIELIMAELRSREKQRDEDRDRVKGLEADVREVRTDIRDIKNALIGEK